ncbi:MAG: discoidin domain-containing protein [Alloprevotella sp.]
MKHDLRRLWLWMLSIVIPALGMAQVDGTVTVTGSLTDGSVTIENGYVSRTFNLTDSKLTPGAIVNKRISEGTFTPSEGSEEFKIKTLVNDDLTVINGLLDRSAWTVTVDGWANDGSTGSPAAITDGDATTYWHSWFNGGGGSGSGAAGGTSAPHWISIDLGSEQQVASFAYQPRNHSNGPAINGMARGYTIQTSTDGTTWTDVCSSFMPWRDCPIWVNLPEVLTTRYFRFAITSAHNGSTHANCAEFYLSSEKQVGAHLMPLDISDASVTGSSWCADGQSNASLSFLVDGKDQTYWHS